MLNVTEKKVQFIIDLKFQHNNLCDNVHDVSLEDKTSIKDDEIIESYEIFKEEVQPTLNLRIKPNSRIEVVQQNKVEEVEMIIMVLSIYIEDKKVVVRSVQNPI